MIGLIGDPLTPSVVIPVLLKADTVGEVTAAAGVTIDGVELKDGGATLTADLDMGGNIVQNANITVAANLYRYGDADTGKLFAEDTFFFQAGNVKFLTIQEGFFDKLIVNDNGVDIDFIVKTVGQANALFVRGSDGKVGIRDNAPNSVVDVTGDINTTEQYKVDDVQVVSNRVIDERCDDALNSGDATTDGVIDALRDAMITHGLIAAA